MAEICLVEKNARMYRILCKYIFPLVLVCYPFRNINIGLDLWDVGYNYANFTYMGLEHMDSMWLFSTYLANALGHFFTLLPGGDTLIGLNFYTGLMVSLLALVSYRFLIRNLQIPEWLVFAGEFVAISLSWCPSAVLYNYLTYFLLLIAVIYIYKGLVGEKGIYLVIAGSVLGTNVFVRFANIPEAGLILAVWVYGIISCKKISKVLKETGLCVLGYVCALVFWLGYLFLRYGFSTYITGIKQLFLMSDEATNYSIKSLIKGVFSSYIQDLHWVLWIVFFLALAIVVVTWSRKDIKWIVYILMSVVTIIWLYGGKFCDLRFDEYSSMQHPSILFLMLALLVCCIRIMQNGVHKEEKLLAMLIALLIFISAFGSSTGVFSSINNLFLVAPYVMLNICKFCHTSMEKVKICISTGDNKWYMQLNLVAVKVMLVLVVCIFLFQSILFGANFIYVEASGAKNANTEVENSNLLKGVYMSEERAKWMKEINEYVERNQLSGKEVILYGYIPGLSFYLKMPSAFNPWSDLSSYSTETMNYAMAQLEKELVEGADFPVVILEQNVINNGIDEIEDQKLAKILDFINKYGYIETFSNAKFILYEVK